MKVGVVGAGRVGAACALSLVVRGSAREVILVDRTRARAKAVVTDLRYGAPLCPEVELGDGDYADLAGADLVMLAAGINEKSGGATDRNDRQGRLKLLDTNVGVFTDMVPKIVDAAPNAVLLVVTDPPDALADLARRLAGHNRVLSTGTLIDSLRLRVHLAERLEVSPASVEAQVVGEHGTSEVMLWSSARVSGVPISEALRAGMSFDDFRKSVERDVRYANITIIEGNGASQFGIGIVSARIAEAVLRDERAVLPIGSYNPRYGVTLSLPSIIGREGVNRILEPAMSDEEREAFNQSAEVLRQAAQRTSQKSPRLVDVSADTARMISGTTHIVAPDNSAHQNA
jgi:L-lactate dehydrogenase